MSATVPDCVEDFSHLLEKETDSGCHETPDLLEMVLKQPPDLRIQVQGCQEVTFLVHSCVVAGSRELQEILKEKEENQHQFKITNISVEVLRALLSHLYQPSEDFLDTLSTRHLLELHPLSPPSLQVKVLARLSSLPLSLLGEATSCLHISSPSEASVVLEARLLELLTSGLKTGEELGREVLLHLCPATGEVSLPLHCLLTRQGRSVRFSGQVEEVVVRQGCAVVARTARNKRKAEKKRRAREKRSVLVSGSSNDSGFASSLEEASVIEDLVVRQLGDLVLNTSDEGAGGLETSDFMFNMEF